MIGIKVTEENKANNNLPYPIDYVIVRGSYPNKWVGVKVVAGGYATRTDLHYQDGHRDVVVPELLPTEKKGEIYFDEENDRFTYHVIPKTDEELQQEQVAISESNKKQIVKQITEQSVVDDAQNYDDTAALDNKDLYPMWDGNGFAYVLGFKCQDFDDDGVLVLWKCVQGITSQAQFPPRTIPAHFTRVAYPGEVLPWVQPTGAHDAYDIGDEVTHEGFYWTSLIPANTTEPSDVAVASGWWAKGDPV